MKRKMRNVFLALLFLTGFGVLIYPTVANQWNTYRQSKLIRRYKEVTEDFEKKILQESGKRQSVIMMVSQSMFRKQKVFSKKKQKGRGIRSIIKY